MDESKIRMSSPETLMPVPKTSPESVYEVNLVKILKEQGATFFGENNQILPEGYQFVNRTFLDCYERYHGNWVEIKREIENAEQQFGTEKENSVVRLLRERFRYEINQSAARLRLRETRSYRDINLIPPEEISRLANDFFRVHGLNRRDATPGTVKEDEFLRSFRELERLRKLDLTRNPIIQRLNRINVTQLYDINGQINKKGLSFVENLFEDLNGRHDGKFVNMRRDILDSRDADPLSAREIDLLQRLEARFNYQIVFQAAQVARNGAWSTQDLSYEEIFNLAEKSREQYDSYVKPMTWMSLQVREEVFLILLKKDYDAHLDRAIAEEEIDFNDEVKRVAFSSSFVPDSLEEKTQVGRKPSFRLISVQTKKGGFITLPLNIEVIREAVTRSALVLLLAALGARTAAGFFNVGKELKEPPKAGDTSLVAASFAGLGNSQTLDVLSPQTVVREKQGLSVLVSGAPTVYDKGVWEQVLDRRLKGTWVNKGIKEKEKYTPPLNRELADNPKIAALIRNHQVVAVNPADFNLEYRQLSQRLVTSAKRQGLSEEATAKTLNSNPGLRKMAESLIGQIVYVKLPDGTLKEMAIMDTASNSDAFKLSLASSKFIADFDPNFLEREFSLKWVPRTKDKPGYFLDLRTGRQATSLSEVSLFSQDLRSRG